MAHHRSRDSGHGEKTVRGVDMPGVRMTGWGWAYLALYVALPILAIAFLLDLALYLVADRVFGVCYALLCLF